MSTPVKNTLLKIYVGEKYFSHGIPLYEQILWEAKTLHVSGATAVKGVMGLGHVGTLQSRDNGRNDDLPIIIEIVDTPAKVEEFVAHIMGQLGNHGLVITMNDVNVLHRGVTWPHSSPGQEVKTYD